MIGFAAPRRLSASLSLLVLLATMADLSCSRVKTQFRSDSAKMEAEKFFTSFSILNHETEAYWGMKSLKVFGRDWLFSFIAAGDTNATKVSDSPETYEVIIPFWCEGQSINGDWIRLKRDFHVKVEAMEDRAGWKVADPEFRNDQPLTLLQQLRSFLGWGLISPLLALFLVQDFMSFGGGRGSLSFFILAILNLLVLAYLSSVCFGSFVPLIISFPVYIIFWIKLVMVAQER